MTLPPLDSLHHLRGEKQNSQASHCSESIHVILTTLGLGREVGHWSGGKARELRRSITPQEFLLGEVEAVNVLAQVTQE